MIHHKSASAWVIGLALFSMFFGAGNLIFSITVGKHAEHMFAYGTLGFLITAVLLPFAGVVTMVLFNGDYMKFFGVMGRRLGFLIAFLLLTFWIPFGSGPRCVTLAYAAVSTYIPQLPLWVFSLVYTALIFSLTYRESRILTILGKVLTPVLLLSLIAVVVAGLWNNPSLTTNNHGGFQIFLMGLQEGYNTQDLIASFFFSAAIIHILTHSEEGVEKGYLSLVLRGSVIAISVLAVVYLGLLYMGAAYSSTLAETAKDSLLTQLSVHLLGAQGAFFPVCAIAVACVTTSVALMLVFTNFLKETVCQDRISHGTSLGITVGVTFMMSLLGFEGISVVLANAMRIFYPLLIGLMIVNLSVLAVTKKKAKGAAASLEEERDAA